MEEHFEEGLEDITGWKLERDKEEIERKVEEWKAQWKE